MSLHHFFPDFSFFSISESLRIPMFLCGSVLVFLCLSMCLCHLVFVSRCIPLTVCVSLCVPVTFCFLSHNFFFCVTLNIPVPASGLCVPPTQYPFFFLISQRSTRGQHKPTQQAEPRWVGLDQSVCPLALPVPSGCPCPTFSISPESCGLCGWF